MFNMRLLPPVQEQRLEQKLEPHSPILDPPELTRDAEGHDSAGLDDILGHGRLSQRDKMLSVESALLDLWSHAYTWRSYLDSPLISHADAALSLKSLFETVVAIETAGNSYADIFRIMGFPVYSIDYSHHKRNMEQPVFDSYYLPELKGRVLLVDIDFVTGKTLTKVSEYLRGKGVNVRGAYMGLSRWPGIKSAGYYVGDDTVNFDRFWKGRQNGLMHIRNNRPYRTGIVPQYLRLFSPNPNLSATQDLGASAARRIARVLKKI